MPRRSDLAVHTFSVFVRSTLLLLIVLISNTAHGYDCGDSKDCSLEQLANYLDRIKDRFETPDYKYDQIYAEGDNTIVFVQRILHAMNKSERSYVKIEVHHQRYQSTSDQRIYDQVIGLLTEISLCGHRVRAALN